MGGTAKRGFETFFPLPILYFLTIIKGKNISYFFEVFIDA